LFPLLTVVHPCELQEFAGSSWYEVKYQRLK